MSYLFVQANVGGALTLTKQAKDKSDEAARKVNEVIADADGATSMTLCMLIDRHMVM